MNNVKKLGIVSPVPKDEWDSSVSYNILNIVSHKGMVFIAKDSSIGIEPFVDPQWKKYWMYLLTSGTSATNLLTTDDIVDDLTTDDAKKVLSARQGKILNDTKVGLMGDEEISGQKTFTEDIETKDRFVVLNKDATELISGLAGMSIKTGASALLFKGLWEYKNNATNENTAINANTNITCHVKPNKPVALFSMSKTFPVALKG